MAAGVSASLGVSVSAKLSGAPDVGTTAYRADLSKTLQILPGTATTGQADLLFSDTRTLAASGTENLDMTGVLISPLGTTVNAAEIVAIYVEAAAANTNNVVLFGAASNAFNGPLSGTTPKYAVEPGEGVLFTSKKGWTVTAGTGDILLVANSAAGTAVEYTIVIIARSVAA